MRSTRLRTLMLALTLGGWIATTTEASPISQPIDYATTGFVGGGSDPITFTGSTGSFLTPGVISLGSFNVGSLPSDVSQLVNTTFTLDIAFPAGPGGELPWGHAAITGTLNGTITGNLFSDVIATFTSVTQQGSVELPFDLSKFQMIGPVRIGPNGVNGGSTELFAYIGPKLAGQEVPEPSTLALFAVGLAGFGYARRHRNKALSC